MTLDPNKYLIQKPNIITWILSKKDNFDYLKEPGYIAMAKGVPIIIVDYWVGETLGWPEEIREKIKRDMKFYHVEGVVGYEKSI